LSRFRRHYGYAIIFATFSPPHYDYEFSPHSYADGCAFMIAAAIAASFDS